MLRARFIGGLQLSAGEKINLITVISMNNKMQTGISFQAFINLVNKHKKRITNLQIILSNDLYRHYVENEKATLMALNWIEENKKYLEELETPYEIIYWQFFIKSDQFFKLHLKVLSLFETDEEFSSIINDMIKKYAEIYGEKNARNYLLEECAVSLMFEGVECYPSESLNNAILYVMGKIEHSKIYVGYKVYQIKKTQMSDKNHNTESQLLNFCLSTTKLLEMNGIINPEDQIKFFQEFIFLKERFLNQEDVRMPELNILSKERLEVD